MKKIVLLSAAMSLALSSLTFAADNPPPPPGKAVAGQQHNGHDKNRQQHSGKRPAQGASHNGKQPPKGKSSAQGNKQPSKDGQHNGNPLPPKKSSLFGPTRVSRRAFFRLSSGKADADFALL